MTFKKLKTLVRGFSLPEVAVSLAVTGIVAGAYFDVSRTSKEIKTNNDIVAKLTRIEQAIDVFVANNGRLPCPASRIAPLASTTYGIETNCNSAAPAGTVDSGLIRIGAIPVRTLDLPDDFMIDPWDNRITYAAAVGLAQNNVNYDNFSTTLPDVIRINDANNIRKNTDNVPGVRESIISWVVLSHGKNGNGAYTSKGIGKTCTASLDQENCNDDAIFRHSNFNPNENNYYDDYIIWKAKDQQSFDKQTIVEYTPPVENVECPTIYSPDAFSPKDIDGLRLWLDAQDSETLFKKKSCSNNAAPGDKIKCWKDKSGNGYHAKHAGKKKLQPKLEESDDSRYLIFDKDLLEINDNNGAVFPKNSDITQVEFFSVVALIDDKNGYIFNDSNNQIRFSAFNGSSSANWKFGQSNSNNFSSTYDESIKLWNCTSKNTSPGSTQKCWANDAIALSQTNTYPAIDYDEKTFYIGCESDDADDCQRMNLHELIIYNKTLTNTERQKVRTYLKKKWQLLESD